MRSFKTEKGTELPLLDLRGKPYLQVAHRLVWFREEHPDWTIETNLIETTEQHTISKAIIRDSAGKIMATGHKQENLKGFADHLEKSETGAIGRALAMCGYGTQFAPELEEGERLADAPAERVRQAPPTRTKQPAPNNSFDHAFDEIPSTKTYLDDPGLFEIRFGKLRGKKLKDVPRKDLVSYMNWMTGPQGGTVTEDGKKFLEQASRFLGGRTEN